MAAGQQAGLTARLNELLVRTRRPLDMAAQVLAALFVCALLQGAVPALWLAGYAIATLVVILIQIGLHRAYLADHLRRRRGPLWLGRFAAVYAVNAALLGAAVCVTAALPRDETVLVAAFALLGMLVSVSLTVAPQFLLSLLVASIGFGLPAIYLLASGERSDYAAAGLMALILVFDTGFAWRLHAYHRRGVHLVARLRLSLRERERASVAAQETERRLRSVLDSAPFPIVVARRSDGGFLYCNRPAAELFGIEPPNDDGAAPRYQLDPSHHARIFGAAPDREAEFQLAVAGRVIWATIAAVPMSYAETESALVVVNDVTARRTSEARLRMAEQRLLDAISALPDGVALYGPDRRLVICNQSYAATIGVPLDASVGLTHEQVSDASLANRPAAEQAGMRTDYAAWRAQRIASFDAARGEPHIFYDTRDRRWLQIRDVRLTDGGTASLITDITELKARERDLQAANASLASHAEELARRTETLETARRAAIKAHQEAELANRAKSQFLAHMSHELRTPLNAIIGFSEIMALQLLGASGVPQYDRYAGDILAAGRHLLAVIDDILDLSKVEAGKMKLRPAAVPWPRLKADCITLLRPLAADRLVSLIAMPGGDDLTIMADERLAKQMLVNLLSNAVKYTPSGGRVSFRLEALPDGGRLISVADTGVGMTAADIAKALEPFSQADSAMISQMRGTGLGLPLVKGLIELHGGRLEIESAPGAGTIVKLYFPKNVPESAISEAIGYEI